MHFTPNDDQAAFFAVLEQMMASDDAGWRNAPEWARFDWSAAFDATLDQNGFFDCAAEPTLGPVAGAAMIYRLATLPVLVEGAASALLRPLHAPDLPRPLAVIEGDVRAPVRFLPVAKSVLVIGADGVHAAILGDAAARPVDSIFAYPMGQLPDGGLDWRPVAADPEAVRQTWRIAVAAELAGVLKGGLDAVVRHVKDREQFGRPLGSFQTIQHRLAAAATKVEASYWLTLRAAQGLAPDDAATALAYVQEASTRIVYDLHQFMGAMGLTLEHPLHRWTYRARLLRSALGGAGANTRAVSARRWRTA